MYTMSAQRLRGWPTFYEWYTNVLRLLGKRNNINTRIERTNLSRLCECDPHSHSLLTNYTYPRPGVNGMSHLLSLLSARHIGIGL